MRVKSLQEPTGVAVGDHWLSPDGHSVHWTRVWNGKIWQDYEVELKVEEEEDLEEDDDTEEEEPPTEETKGERSNTAEVPDRDRQQKPDQGSKQPAAGKQGQGRQGKRGK